MNSKKKIADSWRIGWKPKAYISFVPCLKVFKLLVEALLIRKIKIKVNQRFDVSNIVLKIKCGLCKKDYVGFTNLHLFQHIHEDTNSRSSIGKHMKLQYGVQRPAIAENFTILKKCQS